MNLSEEIKEELELETYAFFKDKLNGLSGEVNMLHAIHRDIKQLGDEWNRILASTSKNIKISMDSYFIHQTPMVAYTGLKKSSIEFGDVLYLYTETDNGNNNKETALLMQAKVFENSKVDPYQLALYTDWPTFWFKRKDIHAANFNVVSTPQPHPGGRYLLLDDSTSNSDFASTGTPKSGLKANEFDNYLERELIGLLEFSEGKELQGDWETAIKAIEKEVKANIKPFKSTLRRQPLLYVMNNQSGTPSFPTTDKQDKGLWFVHIQATVPFRD